MNVPTKEGVIYMITSPESKSYIGKTMHLSRRISAHKSNNSACRLIRDAFRKYKDKMKVSVLLRCPVEDLDSNETMYIEKMDTVHPRGYNLRCGNVAGETKQRGILSTCVEEPVEFYNEEDYEAVVADIVEIMDDEAISQDFTKQYMPWAGPVRKHYVPWTATFGGITMSFEIPAEHAAALAKAKAKVAELEATADASEAKATEAEATTRITKAQTDAELERYRLMKAEQMSSDDIKTTQMQNQMHLDIEKLKKTIAACEELGMQEEAKSLKRKLVDI